MAEKDRRQIPLLPVLFCVIRCSMFGIQCSMYGILWIVFSFAIGTPQIFYNGTIEETSIVCTTDRKAKIMFNNLFGYDIFGVDSTNLHWKEGIIRKVRELADEHECTADDDAFDSVWELLDSELPSSLAFHVDGGHTYIGIPAGFPFDMPDDVYKLITRSYAARFVANTLKEFFTETPDEIAMACHTYSGVEE